jgi:hypothetical protein
VTRLAAALQLPGRLRVHQETTGVVFSGRRMVLLHWPQNRTLSGD